MYKRLMKSPAARRRTSLIVAAVLFLPFLFFFAGGTAPPGPGGIAGKMFGKPVPWETFDAQRRWLRMQMDETSRSLPAAFVEPWLEQQAWDRLVLLEEARRRRLHVPDAEVARTIREIPAFQDQGRFVADRYARYVQFLGSTPSAFESMIRSQLVIDKLLRGTRDAAAPSEIQVLAAVVEDRERIQGRAFVFDAASHREAVAAAVTDEAVRAYYDAHQDAVRVPERIAIEYVGLTQAEAAAGIQPTEEELRAYYATHQEAFAGEDKTPKPFEQAQEDVRSRLVDERAARQLATFAMDLEDARTQGWRFEELVVGRGLAAHAAGPMRTDARDGQVEPALLDALSKLRVGGLSDVVETGTGVYLGRLTQRLPAEVPPLEQVRGIVRERLTLERMREAALSAARAFRTRIQDRIVGGWRLDETLLVEGAAGTPVDFTRTQRLDPLGIEAPEANRAAFAVPLGTLTEAMPTQSGAILLLPEARVAPDAAAIAHALENDRANIVTRKETEVLQRWLEDLRARANVERAMGKPNG